MANTSLKDIVDQKLVIQQFQANQRGQALASLVQMSRRSCIGFPTMCLVLSDFVECMSEVPFPP